MTRQRSRNRSEWRLSAVPLLRERRTAALDHLSRESMISPFDLLTRNAHWQKNVGMKSGGEGGNGGNLVVAEGTQPVGPASSRPTWESESRGAASRLRNSGTFTGHDVVQFAHLRAIHFSALFLFLIARRTAEQLDLANEGGFITVHATRDIVRCSPSLAPLSLKTRGITC